MIAVHRRPPSVSVIMPVFRAANTIGRALASVAAQTQPPAELIVVDDASDDDTPAVLSSLAQQRWPFVCKIVRLRANVGPGEARNAGWEQAEGECIAFLDADDAWFPGKLERQLRWMSEHQEYAWSAHRCTWGEHEVGRSEGVKVGSGKAFEELTQNRLLWRNPVATPTVLLQRDVPSRFRTGWRHCEDLMLWQDLLAADCRGALLPEPMARLGRRPTARGGLTGDLRAMHAGEMRALEVLRREGRYGRLQAAGWALYLRAKYVRRRMRQ